MPYKNGTFDIMIIIIIINIIIIYIIVINIIIIIIDSKNGYKNVLYLYNGRLNTDYSKTLILYMYIIVENIFVSDTY